MGGLYQKGLEAILDGRVAWSSSDAEALLIDVSAYAVDLDTHELVGCIPAEAVRARALLTNKRSVLGVAFADSVTFKKVSGRPCGALVITASGVLLSYFDGPGFPVKPVGTDIVFDWSEKGIFRI